MPVYGQGKLSTSLYFPVTPSTGAFAGFTLPTSLPFGLTLQFGTGGSNLGNLLAYLPLTFVASTPQTANLTAILDPLGNTINYANVRLLIGVNFATTPGHDLLLGDAAANEWDAFLSAAGTLRVPASVNTNPYDGFVVISCPNGLPVSGTSCYLKMDPGANAFNAALFLVGSTT